MLKATIYHNNRCSKSRQTMAILEEKGVDIETVYYLETPPSKEVLTELLALLKLKPLALIRTGEARFSELGLTKQDMKSDDEWLEIMIQNPILIERPIVVANNQAVIGRPPENVLSILELD